MELILCAAALCVSAAGLVLLILERKRLEKLRRTVSGFGGALQGATTALRALSESASRMEAALQKLLKQREEAPDEETARRAREEIDRFNAGIANILSFGVDAKGGGGK